MDTKKSHVLGRKSTCTAAFPATGSWEISNSSAAEQPHFIAGTFQDGKPGSVGSPRRRWMDGLLSLCAVLSIPPAYCGAERNQLIQIPQQGQRSCQVDEVPVGNVAWILLMRLASLMPDCHARVCRPGGFMQTSFCLLFYICLTVVCKSLFPPSFS